jgi:hypothetical protein
MEEDSRVGESSLQLRIGEKYTRRQMLYGLMLKSANDVAHALGRDRSVRDAAAALSADRQHKTLFMDSWCSSHDAAPCEAGDLASIEP